MALVSQKKQLAETAAEMGQQLQAKTQELEKLQNAKEAKKTAAARIGGLEAIEQQLTAQLAESRQHILTIQVEARLQMLRTRRLARCTVDIHNPTATAEDAAYD